MDPLALGSGRCPAGGFSELEQPGEPHVRVECVPVLYGGVQSIEIFAPPDAGLEG